VFIQYQSRGWAPRSGFQLKTPFRGPVHVIILFSKQGAGRPATIKSTFLSTGPRMTVNSEICEGRNAILRALSCVDWDRCAQVKSDFIGQVCVKSILGGAPFVIFQKWRFCGAKGSSFKNDDQRSGESNGPTGTNRPLRSHFTRGPSKSY
jgi:hypothetical protein